MNESHFLQAANDERFEQNKSHLLWQTALIESEVRTDDDDGTAGIVDALAKQILAESTRFALEHVGHRFERTIACTGDRAAVSTVVKQGVNSLLKHALFVADDDIRRAQLEKVLEAVVAVDDPAIQIVQVRRCKAATFKRHQWAKVWRNNRKHFHDHCFWTAV